MGNFYLLDTNILVHFVRSDALWQDIRQRYGLMLAEPTPRVSVVSDGELRSLAVQFDWQADKLSQMNFGLSYFRRESIDQRDVLEAYASIDSYTQLIGKPMGKNDVWIAATASATGAVLLTTDHDFDFLSPTFLQRIWIDPTVP